MNKQVKSLQKGLDNIVKDAKGTSQELVKTANKLANDTSKNVSKLAKNTGDTINNTLEQAESSVYNVKKDIDLYRYSPIYKDDIYEKGYKLTTMIHLVTNDKRKKNKYFAKAIGFKDHTKGVNYLTICRKDIAQYNISFYPNKKGTIYYQHPFNSHLYIDLNSYFTYLRTQRVNELEMIAQKLGASYFKITYKEKKKTSTTHSNKVEAKGMKDLIKGKGDISNSKTNKEEYNFGIASEVSFKGQHTPVKPELHYFKNDSDIENLIAMRLDTNNPINGKICELDYKQSIGISTKEAAKLDIALKDMNCSCNVSISKEVSNELHTTLKYEIRF